MRYDSLTLASLPKVSLCDALTSSSDASALQAAPRQTFRLARSERRRVMKGRTPAIPVQILILTALLVSMLIARLDFAHGQAQSLVDQAKKEGEVVLYTTMNVSDFAVFGPAIKEKYPFLNVRTEDRKVADVHRGV